MATAFPNEKYTQAWYHYTTEGCDMAAKLEERGIVYTMPYYSINRLPALSQMVCVVLPA